MKRKEGREAGREGGSGKRKKGNAQEQEGRENTTVPGSHSEYNQSHVVLLPGEVSH